MKKKKYEPTLTTWGNQMNLAAPLQEYPRPQLWRKNYYLLNGLWEFTVQKSGMPRPMQYADTIVVPFAPESVLSGVGHGVEKDEHLWYRHRLDYPKSFLKDKLFCHFGGVDQSCIVYLNGYRVGYHHGGFLPFTMELTPFLHSRKENILEVEVWDDTERGDFAYGLQSEKERPLHLPAFSGIWQTVWLESVPMTYIKGLKITPFYDDAAVRIELMDGGIPKAHVDVLSQGTRVAAGSFDETGVCRISLDQFKSWTPEHPFLYDLRVYAGEDEVESYFAMRKVAAQQDENGHVRFYLNNEPYFFKAVLDDGFWSDGIATPPGDLAIRKDLENIKALGFQAVRKHQKVEPMRWYYHCDRLGLLVLQDMPRGGRSCKAEKATHGLPRQDKPSRFFGCSDIVGREMFEEELTQLVEQFYNTPSVVAYTLFENGKGQFDSLRLTEKLWIQDPTRLVSHAAGGYDQGGSDFKSVSALKNYGRCKADKRILLIDSFGGFGVGGGCGAAGRPCKNGYEQREQLRAAYEKVQQTVQCGLSGCVFVRYADLPGGSDGLYSADRSVRKDAADEVKELNRHLCGTK